MTAFIPERDADGQIMALRPAGAPAATPTPPQPIPETQRPIRDLLPDPHTTPPAAAVMHPRAVLAAVLCALLVLAIAGTAMLGAGASAYDPGPATPSTVATTSATPIAQLPRAIVAWPSPAGEVLGALDRGRPYTLLGRAGVDWIQIDAGDSGRVWVRSSDLGLSAGMVLALVDLSTPTPQPTAVPTAAPTLPIPVPTDEPPCTPDRAVAHLRSIYGEVWSCLSAEHAQQLMATVEAQAKGAKE